MTSPTAWKNTCGLSAEPFFMTRDDGTAVTDVPSWKPRMFEITRKFEQRYFGVMGQMPKDLEMKCISEYPSAMNGMATVKRIQFTWGRLYDKGTFHATAVIPNSTAFSAAFMYLREGEVSEIPVSTEDWPVDEIISRGYSTVAIDGGELTPPDAHDAIAQRAWALRMVYEWIRTEPRIDEMTVGPVGCGPLDGVASLWAGSYDWRCYLCIAAQCGLDRSFAELAANNTPGLFYSSSVTDETQEEIAGDRALAEDVSPAWNIYCGIRGYGGNTDWHLRQGARGLVREDWRKFMDFTDRHGWSIGDKQHPEADVPALNTTTKEEWEQVTRPKYVKFFSEKVYGVMPGKPEDLTFTRTAPDCEMVLEGDTPVVRMLLEASWTGKCGKGSFPFQAFIPKSASKVPATLYLSLGKKGRMDPERKEKTTNWDVEQICKRGYAAVGVYYEDISPDCPHDFNVPPFNAFERAEERNPESWCAISAWAWGLSRVMDWIETEPRIDSKHVIVAGHSRGGKTALWAGVSDTRFAMSVPFGSGRTGMMLSHIKTPFPTETIALINSGEPHWFTPYYKSLAHHDLETDFDHHQLAACMAPRLLYVCEKTGDMSRFGDWYSAVLASPAWNLYGMKGLEMGSLPEVDKPACSDGVGFQLTYGPHNVTEKDWKGVLDFADAHNFRK